MGNSGDVLFLEDRQQDVQPLPGFVHLQQGVTDVRR
jgi:hypothetical protein